MAAYYNEHDPKTAAWLRELIRRGHIAPGDVDERSIVDVRAHEIRKYRQRHFFAGVGGWSFALRLAGVPDDAERDTGSCPCQPFSAAGLGLGIADPRHLWPAFFNLLCELGSARVYGEQVASPAALAWLDGVFADLESADYACWAADLCAAGSGEEGFGWILRGDRISIEPILIGSPNIRQRIYWMGDSLRRGRNQEPGRHDEIDRSGGGQFELTESSRLGRLALTDGRQSGDGDLQCRRQHGLQSKDARSGGVEYPPSDGREQRWTESSRRSFIGGRSPWDSFDILPCTDGKARRIESGSFPLAHGVSGRVGLLRGYGNAINPWLAADFIRICES